jgi:WD40 repeat protein
MNVKLVTVSLLIFVHSSMSQPFPVMHLKYLDETQPIESTSYLEFFPKHNHIVTASYKTIYFWGMKSGIVEKKIETEYPISHLAVSPDLEYAAHSYSDDDVVVYDLQTAEKLYTIDLSPRDIGRNDPPLYFKDDIIFAPDGLSFFVFFGFGIHVIETKTGEIINGISFSGSDPSYMELFNDGRRLFVYNGGQGHIVDISTGQKKEIILDEKNMYISHMLSGDRTSLVASRSVYNDPAYDLFTLNPDNYEIVNSLGTFDRDKLLRYHLVPGDKYIFNIRSGGSGELIDISTKSYAFSISEIVRSYVSNDTASMIIHTFDFSPDGKLLGFDYGADVFIVDISSLTSRVPNALEYTSFGD